jgi:serine/threonine protein phosphatase PrpC
MSSEEDVVVVLGSDGIFDVLSDAEAGLYKPKPS